MFPCDVTRFVGTVQCIDRAAPPTTQDSVDNLLCRLQESRSRVCAEVFAWDHTKMAVVEQYLNTLCIFYQKFIEPRRDAFTGTSGVPPPLFAWYDPSSECTYTSTCVRFEIICAAMLYAQLLYAWCVDETSGVRLELRARASYVGVMVCRDVASYQHRQCTLQIALGCIDANGNVADWTPAMPLEMTHEAIQSMRFMFEACCQEIATRIYRDDVAKRQAERDEAQTDGGDDIGAMYAVGAPDPAAQKMRDRMHLASMNRRTYDYYDAIAKHTGSEVYDERAAYFLCLAFFELLRAHVRDPSSHTAASAIGTEPEPTQRIESLRLIAAWTMERARVMAKTQETVRFVFEACREMHRTLCADSDRLVLTNDQHARWIEQDMAQLDALDDVLETMIERLPGASPPAYEKYTQWCARYMQFVEHHSNTSQTMLSWIKNFRALSAARRPS